VKIDTAYEILSKLQRAAELMAEAGDMITRETLREHSLKVKEETMTPEMAEALDRASGYITEEVAVNPHAQDVKNAHRCSSYVVECLEAPCPDCDINSMMGELRNEL
jgi:hypothetical protein